MEIEEPTLPKERTETATEFGRSKAGTIDHRPSKFSNLVSSTIG
jgi:hypothetical protein